MLDDSCQLSVKFQSLKIHWEISVYIICIALKCGLYLYRQASTGAQAEDQSTDSTPINTYGRADSTMIQSGGAEGRSYVASDIYNTMMAGRQMTGE